MNVVTLLIPFWVICLSILGSILAPKSVPKLVHKIEFLQVNFQNPFFPGLKALQVTLESLLEPLMLVLGAPKTQKVWFSICKIILFAIAVFRYFEALEVLLGTILAHHGLFSSKMAPKIKPTWGPKIRKHMSEKGSTV